MNNRCKDITVNAQYYILCIDIISIKIILLLVSAKPFINSLNKYSPSMYYV